MFCFLDFEIQGMIVDDEINVIIVCFFLYGVKFYFIIDVCYSGIVFDLLFLCRMDRLVFLFL